MSARPPLYAERGGSGSPLLVLLHGLGANAAVWDDLLPIVRARWAGRWIAPDLRGHGRSSHAAPYGYGTHAADVAALLDAADDVVVLAHSMGGVVGLALATQWFGVRVRTVVAFGVKPDFNAEEIARIRGVGNAGHRWFDTREAAIERQIAVAGLRGLISADDPRATIGIAAAEGKFRIAMDPLANLVLGPELRESLAAADAPVRFAAGDRDPLVAVAAMRAIDPSAHVFPGLGHNVHVEDPLALWEFAAPLLTTRVPA
ncbi:MAG TPA: alpha/beta hydrolase [Candidatus Lustribacter sp.]